MYIKREPLGQGNLTFRQRRRRLPFFGIAVYLLVLAAAVYVFLHLDRYQPRVLAMMSPDPTATPSAGEHQLQAEAMYQQGNLLAAADAYRLALAMDPENLDLLFELSRMLTMSAQLDPLLLEDETTANLQEAEDIADQIILLAPEDPRGHAAKSRALDYLGEVQQAAVEAIRAVEIDPDYALGNAYLAEAYADLRQLRQAREAAQRAIELDPYSVDARRNYAYVLEFYGDYGGAVQQYLQAIQLHGNLLDLWYGLARNYRGAGQIESAIQTYEQIIRRIPEDPRPYTELGRTYFEVRDDDAAQSVLESAVGLVCEDCPLFSYEELARNNYQYDLALLPDTIYEPAWRRLGQVYHTRRNFEDAVAIYEELVAFYESDGEDAPIEAYLVLASDYYYIDRSPEDQPLCDRALHYADSALDLYELRRYDDEVMLNNILSVYVLCRDYALTPPSEPVQFPRGYAEPNVIVERPGAEPTVEDGSQDGETPDAMATEEP